MTNLESPMTLILFVFALGYCEVKPAMNASYSATLLVAGKTNWVALGMSTPSGERRTILSPVPIHVRAYLYAGTSR